MAELRMVVDEGDEVLHATSSHEALKVTGVRMNQIEQVCALCNIWKMLPCDLSMYADSILSRLITPTIRK